MKTYIRAALALTLALFVLCLLPASGRGASVTAQAATEGWRENSKGWWYQRADGTWPAEEWLEINSRWYYFNSDGYMVTGWLELDGKWYFLKDNGAMATGWALAPANTGEDEWFYFNAGGSMKTGWLEYGGAWYYLGKSMYHDNVYEINGSKYCFSSGGKMLTGWRQWKTEDGDTEWFYFRDSGKLHIGWLEYKGYWYYFNEQMYHASEDRDYAVATIGGKQYKFDRDGHWIQ
ncbi:MAG: hypothetical protein IJU99_08975 [Lachnospiraceae bacterium]|nr:hypothetical protein [Lachnospiraceae bacterium]